MSTEVENEIIETIQQKITDENVIHKTIKDPYGFIYITTNLVNGMRYLGQKSFNQKDWKTYLGSGMAFKKALNKYGRENFQKNIIYICYSEEELNQTEYELSVYLDVVESKDWYNLVFGGGTSRGWHPSEETRRKQSESAIKRFQSEEARKQASESHQGYYPSEDTRKKMSEAQKGKHAGEKHWNYGGIMPEHTKQKLLESHLGISLSEERKKQMSEARTGTRLSEDAKQKISKNAKERLSNPENHPMYGKHLNNETKQKISETLKGKMSGENNPMYGVHRYGENAPMYKKHHSEDTKRKLSENHKGLMTGDKNPFYGKRHTEETKEKLRQARLGKPLAEETKYKLKNQIKTPVRNVEYNTYYKGYVEAEEITGVSRHSIKSCCHGYNGQKTAGRDPYTGEKLHWEHCSIEEYLKHKDEPNQFINKQI